MFDGTLLYATVCPTVLLTWEARGIITACHAIGGQLNSVHWNDMLTSTLSHTEKSLQDPNKQPVKYIWLRIRRSMLCFWPIEAANALQGRRRLV